MQALLCYISFLPPTKFLTRMKDPQALKSKHFQGPCSLVPRVTCPLPEATIRLSLLLNISKPALPMLWAACSCFCTSLSSHQHNSCCSWQWKLTIWITASLAQKRLGSTQIYFWTRSSHSCTDICGGTGRWAGEVNNQGWIAGGRLESCVCAAIGSEAVQLCKKSPLSLGHPWSSGITTIRETSLVTLGHYFQTYLLALTTCIHLSPLTTIPELVKPNTAADFCNKTTTARPWDTKWGGA